MPEFPPDEIYIPISKVAHAWLEPVVKPSAVNAKVGHAWLEVALRPDGVNDKIGHAWLEAVVLNQQNFAVLGIPAPHIRYTVNSSVTVGGALAVSAIPAPRIGYRLYPVEVVNEVTRVHNRGASSAVMLKVVKIRAIQRTVSMLKGVVK